MSKGDLALAETNSVRLLKLLEHTETCCCQSHTSSSRGVQDEYTSNGFTDLEAPPGLDVTCPSTAYGRHICVLSNIQQFNLLI